MNFADVRIAARERRAVGGSATASASRCRRRCEPRLGAYAGKEVTLGIRPEDLHIAGDGRPGRSDASTPWSRWSSGSARRSCSTVAVGPATMVASVEPTATAKVHEKLRLAVNPERLHFFDNETEAAI